ncbi:MAG: response regulator [Gemmatimonadetes bacterium]|nr:response regulator [Gemmatimonadota bacterium]
MGRSDPPGQMGGPRIGNRHDFGAPGPPSRLETQVGGGREMARPVVSVIDPDEGVRESLCELLGTLGIDACAFTSAEGFLSSLRDMEPPACLITELQLRGMSGMDLQRRLRDDGVRVPVIVLATDADIPTAVACMRLGAAHFIEKPIVGPDLAHRIRRLLEPAAHAATGPSAGGPAKPGGPT